MATSVVSAQRVYDAGARNRVGNRGWYVAIAALFIPLAVFFGWLVSRAAQIFPGNCAYIERDWGGYYDCGTQPALPGVIGGAVAAFLLLWFAYRRVRAVQPLLTAFITILSFLAVFIVEFFVGATIVAPLLTTGGPLIYLALAATAIGLITTKWSRSLRRNRAGHMTDHAASGAIDAGGDYPPPPTHDA